MNNCIQDSFYFGLSEKKLLQVQGYNFDHPGINIYYIVYFCSVFSYKIISCHFFLDAFDTERLLSCLKNLRFGNETNIPNYDFKTYEKVLPERKVLKM
jgi:uridine kinase